MTHQRFKLTIEYDGTAFSGWQRQDNAPSVQEFIEKALKSFSQEDITLFVAGRTDAGVHALGQVAHADIPDRFCAERVQRALNFYLKEQAVSILKAEPVSQDFHARFSAKKRHYVYRINTRPSPMVLDKDRVWHHPYPLDVDAMREAATYLIGSHDFSTFRTVHCQAKSPIRTIDSIHIERNRDEINIAFSAQSFLHHQVRNITGTLIMVGCGKWKPSDVKTALEKKNRCAGGPTAPAQGLYFLKVDYA